MKKRIKIFILLFFIAIVTLAIEPTSNIISPNLLPIVTPTPNTYFHDVLKFSISAPATWNMDTTSANYKVMFYPSKTLGNIFILVKAYISAKVVTADGLYFRRSGTVWDGWHLLGVKLADEKTNFLIGSDEKISAIYSKIELGKHLAMKKTIVCEDIYVKNKDRVVIVTSISSEKEWLKHLQIVGFIRKSFYFANEFEDG